MIVVILVEIITIRSWINEEEMRVDKEFHKIGKGTIHVICHVWISRVKSQSKESRLLFVNIKSMTIFEEKYCDKYVVNNLAQLNTQITLYFGLH